MKHTFVLSIILLCCLSSQAAQLRTEQQPTARTVGQTETVSRPSFDQSIMILGFEKPLSSKKESLLIQNRTRETVTRIVLRLVYRTPQNEMLDYRDVTIDEEILPGMTKKITIDSFDQNRQYYYYLTPPTGNSIESSYAFKITFTLLRYDIAITRPNTPESAQ